MIDISELSKILNRLLKDYADKNGNKIDLDSDFYWDTTSEQLYNPYRQPNDLSLGQLSDDWETLLKSSKEETLIPYDMIRIANILKALSVEKPL